MTLVLAQNLLAELLLEVASDDPYNLSESGLDSVIDAVVHDTLALRTQCVQLLETAVAASHTCCQQEQCRFHVSFLLI